MKRKHKSRACVIFLFAAILFSATCSLSCEKTQIRTLPSVEKGIIPKNALNVQVSELSERRTTLVFFETTLTTSQVKAYYQILASKKRWSQSQEGLLRDGFVLTYEGDGKSVEVSVHEKDKKTQVTLTIRKLRD